MKKKKNNRFTTIARIIGVIYVLGWLIYIMFQTTAGDMSSMLSFIPAGIMLLLMLVANQNQVVGGIALLVSGAALAIRYAINVPDAGQQVLNGLLTGGPFIVVGFLYLVAGLEERLKPTG